MKKIGLIMGVSWESSKEYYQMINQFVNDRLGGYYCAEMIMVNVNFQSVVNNLNNNDWDSMNKLLYNAANTLENSGAELIAICANALHNCANYISERIKIPLIHISDATGKEILKDSLKKVGLLGAKCTMSLDFYKERLANYGIEVIIPTEDDMDYIDYVIFEELCKGKFSEESKKSVLDMIGKLQKAGAQGVVLGCTELPMLIKKEDSKIPLFDTMKLHAKTIVDYALKG